MLDTNFERMIVEIIAEKGEQILDNYALCGALLKDKAEGNYNALINRFIEMLKLLVHRKIKMTNDIELIAHQQIEVLKLNYFPEEISFDFTALLCKLLRNYKLQKRPVQSVAEPQISVQASRQKPSVGKSSPHVKLPDYAVLESLCRNDKRLVSIKIETPFGVWDYSKYRPITRESLYMETASLADNMMIFIRNAPKYGGRYLIETRKAGARAISAREADAFGNQLVYSINGVRFEGYRGLGSKGFNLLQKLPEILNH